MKILTRAFLLTGLLLAALLALGAQTASAVPPLKTVLVLSSFQHDLSTNPIAQDESNRFIFDHVALQRFDIPLSLLPPDSIVKNRQYSFWELYSPQIIAASAGGVVLLLLVVYLLGLTRQLHRTRRALSHLNARLETQVQERTAELNQTNTRLQDEITERKRVEAALRENEELKKAVLNSLNAHIAVLDATGRIISVNEPWRNFARANGVRDLVGTVEQVNYLELLRQVEGANPIEITPIRCGIEEVLNGMRSSFQMEYPCDSPSEKRWFSMNVVPLASGQGGVVITHDNITVRKKDEQALRESEQALQGVLQSTADGILAVDSENRVLFVNERFGEMWKIPASVLASKDDAVLLQNVLEQLIKPQEFLKEVQDLYQSKQESFDVLNFKDGRVFERLSRTLIRDEQDSGRVWSFRDVTQRKQAEEQLRESEEKFRGLLDSQEGSIMIYDFDGVHHYANRVSVDSIASSGTAQDIIGKRLHDLYPASTADWQLDQIRQVFTTGQGVGGDFEYAVDNQSSWWHLNLQPIRNASGQVVQVMVNSLNITERKRAEQALRESEERFHSLADTAPVLIWMSGTDTLCNFFNQPWLDFTGRTLEQELGNGWTDGVHTGDFQRCLDTYLQAFHTRQPYSMEYRLRRADGEYRWIVDHGVPRFLSDGSFIGYIGTCLDISDRKRIEEELRDSEARTATILRVSPVVIGVSTAAEGRYTDVNNAFERVLGYSQAEVIGHTSFDLNLWVDNDTRPNILREIQAHGRVENLEIRIRRKSGEVFPALIFITPITLHDTPCLLTMMMDITERKHVEEQLRETGDTLQTIIYSSPLAILTLDAEDRVTMWNPAAEAMFGWSDKQILGQANPTVPTTKTKEYEALRQATLSGMAFSNLDTLRLKKDGTQFPVSLSVAPLRGQQSQVIGRMHVIADITERKKLQEELRQQATTDELTRISNRRHFMELAQSEIKRAVRFKRPPAIALIDIDHFKQINDTFGHAAGDQALVAFTKICQNLIREIDVFARFGGDEFVLLLPETNQEQAYKVVERIRLALATQPIVLDGKPVAFTISAGIASLCGDQESIDTILSQADQALYRAKETGRNNVVRYDELRE
jgi:diguanylate cyclase (GGDEF)-like protein/PAS domain S-box-containing protein